MNLLLRSRQRPEPLTKTLPNARREARIHRLFSSHFQLRTSNFVSGALFFSLALALHAQSNAPVTFHRHIAPIIYENCSGCHRPGEAAPFSLLSYEDVARKGKTIAAATAARVMPPWKAEPVAYAYRNERRLTPEQIALIQDWVQRGMPEGDPAERRDPPQFASGWRLGPPDLVIEMSAPFHVPAEGPDIYRNIAFPLGFAEDKWITAIDIHSTARSALHHVLYFADPTGQVHKRPQEGAQPGFSGMRAGGASISLGAFASGTYPCFFPEGLAMRVPKGSDFVVQYHFHPTGKAESEKSKIGFYFAKQPPRRTLTRIQLPPYFGLFAGIDIPAGEKDYVVRDSYTLPVAIEGVGIGSHAHYLATQMKLTATFPDGDVKTLLWIKDWDFAWQDQYFFKQLVPLPAGTRIDCEIHWDNSAENPNNPSHPPVRVKWGEDSTDEMGSITLMAVTREESDLPALRNDLNRRTSRLVRDRMRHDPELAEKVRRIRAGEE